MRDEGASWALRAALAPGLGGLLARVLEQHARVRLHLHRGLEPEWQAFPYEWLRHEGMELHGRLSVGRDDEPDDRPLDPLDPAREIYVLNLLPRSDPIQPARGLTARGLAQVVDGRAASSLFLSRAELPNLAALCILAHGSEDGESAPFLLPDGSPWSLSTERGVPPLVILLACGDDDGNLIDEARRLIAAGAATVIAPLGRPTLEGARHFLPLFLAHWRAGERVDDVLCRLSADPHGESGARRLLLLGRGDLRISSEVRIEEWPDEALAAAVEGGDAPSLIALLERLTRRCAKAGQDIDEAEAGLRRLLSIDPSDEEAERQLLVMLDAVQEQAPPLVRAWVLPLLAKLAEAYAHDLMPRFEGARSELERSNVPVTAPILHSWSKLYYRQGRYPLALRDTARGVALLDQGNPCARGAGLLGQLVNILIDLDLPREAQICLDDLDDGLANRDDGDARWQRHLSKDRHARIALRLGRPRSALALYRHKRDEAVRRLESDDTASSRQAGRRELAGLLYTAAWLEAEGTEEEMEWVSWSREVLTWLERELADSNRIGFGNFDLLYLLRACAAWGWRRADSPALEMVLAYRTLLRERLFAAAQADPGPPGFCFGFLTLAERDGLLTDPPIPSWDEISASLAGHRYYIELAAFAHLLGRAAESAEYLDRFQAQRTLAPGVEFPAWFHGGLLTNWEAICEARTTYEAEILGTMSPADIPGLVQSGLLPL